MNKFVKYNIYIAAQNIILIVNLFLTIFVYKDDKFIISMALAVPMMAMALNIPVKERLNKCYTFVETSDGVGKILFFSLICIIILTGVLYSLKVNFMPYLFQILSVPLNIYVIAFSIAIKKDSDDTKSIEKE